MGSLNRSIQSHVRWVAVIGAILCPSAVSAQAILVRGRVVDALSGSVVVSAIVRLLPSPLTAVTDSAGSFTLSNVRPGEYTIEIEHLAYGKKQRTLKAGNSSPLETVVTVEPEPTKLDGITVTAMDPEE